MRKNGFTIIEVLGVVVILSVLAIVIYPVITGNINKAKEELYQVNVDEIETAARSWLDQYSGSLPEDSFVIYLSDLKSAGLIDKDITNPKTNNKFADDMEIEIVYDEETDSYKVIVHPDTGTEYEDVEDKKPFILIKNFKVEYVEIGKDPYVLKYDSEDIEAIYNDGSAVDPKDIIIRYVTYKKNTDGNYELVGDADGEMVDTEGSKDLAINDFYRYDVIYEVIHNGVTTRAKRQIIVRDTTPPDLQIPVNQVISRYEKNYNIMQGVSVSDNSCEGLSDSEKNTCNNKIYTSMKTYGNVTPGIIGEYNVTYIAKDSSGNEARKTRTVTVTNDRCPNLKITGTTESGKQTTRLVTLTANVDKEIAENGDYSYQWYQCTSKNINSCTTKLAGQTEKTMVSAYNNPTTNKSNFYTVKILYKDSLECATTSVYETNVKVPDLSCSLTANPAANTWSTSKTITINVKNGNYYDSLKYTYDGKTLSSNQYVETTNGNHKATVTGTISGASLSTECSINTFIDTSKPDITVSTYNANNNAILSTYKNSNVNYSSWVNYPYRVTLSASDVGSGVNRMVVNGTTYGSSATLNVTTNGTSTYTVTVYDNVGNTRTVTLTYRVDRVAPVCGTNTGATAWNNYASRTINVGCTDSNSGCTQGTFTQTFSADAGQVVRTGTITIRDNAGNTAACNVNVYLDRQPPACTSKGGKYGWVNSASSVKSTTLVGTCNDYSGSGCTGNAQYDIDWEGYWTNLSPGTVYDNAGNSTYCPANQTVMHDWTAPKLTQLCNTNTMANHFCNCNGRTSSQCTSGHVKVWVSDNVSGVNGVYQARRAVKWQNKSPYKSCPQTYKNQLDGNNWFTNYSCPSNKCCSKVFNDKNSNGTINWNNHPFTRQSDGTWLSVGLDLVGLTKRSYRVTDVAGNATGEIQDTSTVVYTYSFTNKSECYKGNYNNYFSSCRTF